MNFKKMTFLCMQKLTNFPYIEADFDALTNYELLCKVVEYLNKVIANENAQNEALNELAEAFNNLKSYVDNYFDNLDVQEEINNKLDEMAESGQLTDIIAQYLGLAGMIAFDTVADMKLAQNLVNGSKCKTLGFHSVNDGGGSYYKIRTVTNDDVVDEMTIIEVYDDTLVAELIISEEMSPEQFGCYGNGTTNDTTSFAKACSTCKNIKGTGKYLVNTIELNNVNINCDIKTAENTGLTFQNNVTFTGHLENGIQSTQSNGGKCIYITGTNNIIEDSLFDGLYTGCGVVLENTSLNNRIINSIFDACFKVDVLINGSDVIVENCKFNEHTTTTVSPISEYNNAVKITQYLDLSGTNGKNIVIKNNFMYEHGDNPIDCYTGGSNVIIDGNYIFSPSHECIEIKCENANEDNVNYKIINNTLHGSRCLYIGQNGVGNIKNFVIDNNYFKNYTNSATIIINNFVDTIISNCIFEYDSSYEESAFAILLNYDVTPSTKNKCVMNNCHFEKGVGISSVTSDYYQLYLNNCTANGLTRVSRVNANTEFFVNNCNIKTTAEAFSRIAGKVFVNNCYLENTMTMFIINSSAIASIVNSVIVSSVDVFNRSSGTTPKVAIVCSDYSGSNRLSNFGMTPTVDFTTAS